jgi:hypothetical protein
MSGNPNWNPPLQTSSVRFPRKAAETPQIPPNTTARPRPGTPFQPVYPNPITQIPAITTTITGSGRILDNLYVLSNGTGEAVPYNVTRQTVRGVPIPQVITIATSERYIVFGVNFPYSMSGTDHFVFTFTNQNTNEQTIKNYQQAPQYLVGGIEPGVLYTLTVSPYVNGITYPASPSVGPFSITAISEKNVELQGVTLSGGDRSVYISFTGAIPAPPLALAVTTIAVDDNFNDYQLRCNVISPPGVVNAGYVFISNLTNGSSYIFTVTPYTVTDGIYQYGRPTNLPPYIPGPPSDLYVNSITANVTTAFLTTSYDTIIHPTPVSNTFSLYKSTFTTVCSFVSQPPTVIQDLSRLYAGFTTSTTLFTSADISYLQSTVSANPGIIQVDITDNNTGLWYSFPLASVSGGGIGYVFENSNFTKTQSLYTSPSASYSLLFRQINLGTQVSLVTYSPPITQPIYTSLFQSNYTITGQNYANGLPSIRTTYATIAVGSPLAPTTITGVSGNHIVSISFTGYNPTLLNAGPRPTLFAYNDNYGNRYTSIKPNILINGLTDGSLYTFSIQGFANGVYGGTANYNITPSVRPPSSLSVVSVSNYDVTLSFGTALGGADYYVVATQFGLAQSASAYPYKIQGLSANVSYFFGALSYAYNSAVYSISSSVSANLIQEVSSSYAQFLVSPSGFPYASSIQQHLTEFVPYLYTITASGQGPAPPTVDVSNFNPANIFPVGKSLYASNSISTIALVQNGISAGSAYTVTTSGKVSYTLTSIGISGNYYVLNGGPVNLSNLSGQVLSLSITPISNSLTFPITSLISVYDGSGNLNAYNLQNPSILKSKVTFSGAAIYTTTISAVIPFYDGMLPTTFLGTVSSDVYVPANQNPTYIGPPSKVLFTASGYSSEQIFLDVGVSGYVIPTYYSYAELSGQIAPGISVSPHIVFSGLTNGSSYTFSVSAFGNQVYGLSAQTIRFDLCTNAPRNVFASFSNVTATISYDTSIPAADYYVSDLFDGNTLIQTISNPSGGIFNFPLPVAPRTRYTFKTYGIRNTISSTPCNINSKISGPPAIPLVNSTVLTSGQIVFNWSSGIVDYSEKFRITEYLSNNGVYPTGGVWSNISGFTYTISAVVTASGTQSFAATEWIESGLGYAAFVLTNSYPNFLNTINNKYLSNQIYLTVQQSGGLIYTFPLTTIAPYNSLSNIYTNPNYPKEVLDIFNPKLSLSVTYSYGTGPFNYGKYFYTLDSFANQVYGLSAGIAAQMFVQPVNGVPSVSVVSTTATVSFTQTAITGSVYTVTNNYGSNVSAAPYAFTNLLPGRPYTFTVVVSNGAFISVSSEYSIPLYVGPPSAPTVSTSYYGQTSTVYVTDTTLSLASVFFDSGKQGTGSNIVTPSHTNVIQQVSGGYWVGTGGNGGIKDTLSGFVSSVVGVGSAVYCNDGVANAMYQFTVTPSTGTIAVSLSSYSLFISGTSLAISNGSMQVYSGTITASSYPIQFVSRSVAFGIQSGLSSFYYTSTPASSDVLTISLGGASSFSDYRVYSFNNAGVQASSYTITDQNMTVYNPTLGYTVYSLSGITYAYNLFNISQNFNFTLSVTPFGNGVYGPAGPAPLYIYTDAPGVPFIISLVDTSATVTVASSGLPADSYSLIQYENGNAISTQTQSGAYSPYAVPGLSMWLDAADTTTITSNATTGITQWTDKSMSGYTAVPALFTVPGCVVWVNPGYAWGGFGVITSVPSFGTAGGSITTTAGTVTKVEVAYPSCSYLSFAAGSSMSLPPITYTQRTRTVIAVATVGAAGEIRQFLTGGANSTDIQFYSYNTNIELNYSSFQMQIASSPQNFFNTTSIVCGTSTIADRGIFINGTGQTTSTNNTGDYSPGTTTTQVIGNGGASFNLYEMMIFDGALTASQRQQVEGYLAYKYNLQSKLPPSHPYYTTPFQRVFTVPSSYYLSTMPTMTNTTQNGLNAIATNTGILTVNNFKWTSYSTVFFVAKSPDISYFAGVAATGYTGYIGTFNYGLLATGVANFNDSVLPLGTQVIPINQWCLFSIGYGGGTQATNYAVNGTPRSTTTAAPGASTSTISPLWLSAWGPGSITGGDNITIGEVIHYNRSVTTQERRDIEGYLAYKWGLTSSFATPPTLPATPTTYTFRYPNLSNHKNYYFKAYTTYLGISSQTQPVSTPQREAGRPYPFSGLAASLINSDPTYGNYTLSATLNVGANSNANMTVYVYSGNTQVASQTIASANPQAYSFTVSGGAVYTLSSSALMNSILLAGPTLSITALPFPPLAAAITISTADLGSTYRGIINVTTPSPTQGVTYYYAYSSNSGTTVTALSTTNTFTATYGLSYIGYVYSSNVGLGLQSTLSAQTVLSNIFLAPPSNAVATYTGTSISVNWSASTYYSYYTVKELNGKLVTQSNISPTTLNAQFTGSLQSNYTFQVAVQSSYSPSASIIYSTYAQSPTITLTTLSAAPVAIDYTGSTITLGWTNLGPNYIYSVSQTLGPAVTIPSINPGQNTVSIPNVPLSNTYQFVVGTTLFGISGSNTTSPLITLSTVALTNVSQSIYGYTYTISWSPYPFAGITDYIVTNTLCSAQFFSTRATVSSFTLVNTVSLYTFQVNASYKGISGPVTTLSSVYMYVNPTTSVPTTTYSNSNITITWSAAAQPDGNSKPDRYYVYDTLGGTLSSNIAGTSNTVTLTATVGLSYQFTVTSIYKGLSSPPSAPGSVTRVYTPSATGVTVTNVGSNLFISWTSNTPNATYSISQTLGPPVMTTGYVPVGSATSYTTGAVTTPSDKVFYNFAIIALSNGLSSAVATGIPAYVYTYPPTDVFIYYSNTLLSGRWTLDSRQPNASFRVYATDGNGCNTGSFTTTAGASSAVSFTNGASNSTYFASVFATNNGLVQSAADVSSYNTVTLYTAPPIFNGAGFNGNYAITVNMSPGPQATDARLQDADTYTLTEISNSFFPNASSWTFPLSSVYTIPTLGTQGITYNFNLIATLCGLASVVASPSGTFQLPLITNPVPAGSVVATYSGTLVTVNWTKAAQNNIGNANSDPNGGYTIYVSSLPYPLASQWKTGTSIQFTGTAGSTYQFSIEAVNNNVGSSLVTDASAIVTLYKPVIQSLAVTNSGAIDASGKYYALMTLTWLPDDTNAPGALYTATAYNRTAGKLEATLSTSTTNTLIFNGSLDTTYDLTVTGRYQGITGNPSTVQISNARPILTVDPLFNLGNIITANYSANQAYSSFSLSVTAVTPLASVVSNIVTTSAYSSWRVTTSTDSFTYNISTTAFFNGIPSTTVGRQITLVEPAAPASIGFSYNNSLVTVSWATVTTNASTYAFTAYDLSADPPILASYQPGLFTTTATFVGIRGHTYNVSAFAISSTNITSKGRGLTSTIIIPSAPTGPLTLSNNGTRVIVNWTADSSYGYSFYVSNVAQRGTVIYSNQYAVPGDTFTGVVGETYSVSLFRTSASNVTSTDSIASSWKVYQPSIPFVTFTNVGQDNTVTWPQDVGGSNCVFLLKDNYLYSNLLFPDPTNYLTPSNGWENDTAFTPTRIAGCSLWLDAADPTKIGRVSGAITTWTDKSTNGYVATKLEGTIGSTTLNNLSALNLGSNRMTIPNFVWSNSFTAFVVAKVTSGGYMTGLTNTASSGQAAWLNYLQTGNWSLLYVGPSFSTTDPDYVAGGNPASLPGTENWFIFTVGYNGGTTAQNFTFNGSPCNSTAGTATGLASKTGTYYINGLNTVGYGDCIVAEIIHYNSNLNPLQMTQVTTYLTNKWGIALSSTFKQGPALIHSSNYSATVSGSYTQIGNYISYKVTGNEAYTTGKPYIYSVVPSWNGVNGNTVYTNTTNPIQLYKPTAPGQLSAVGQGFTFTLNWQSSVLYTVPTTTVPSYFVEVSPKIPDTLYPYQSFNTTGTSQTVTNFDSSAGRLSISVTGINPVGYSNTIYGFPASLDYIVPSGTTVSIVQSTLCANTLTVTVPQQTAGTNYMWLLAVGNGLNNAGVPTTTGVLSNRLAYNSNSRNYTLNVCLGYSYTISAYLTTGPASINDGPNGSSPANGNPFPVPTLPASGITVTHNACSVALSWLPVAGAEYYNVFYNPQSAGGISVLNISASTTSITISDNGGRGQFGANLSYSYIIQAFSTSAYRFNGTATHGCNLQSADAISPVVTMFVPTNPLASALSFSQQLSNLTISWPPLTTYPQDNAADIGTPYYTISCGTLTCNVTTGLTATFANIPAPATYSIKLNTRYNGLWGVTPTSTSYTTTVPSITSGPTLADIGSATIRVTATAATVGFWYLGTAQTLMNSPATVASNSITYTFPSVKATTYTCNVKFVTQDTGLSVTSTANAVSTPSLVVSTPTTADAGATRRFSIVLAYTGTPTGGIVWDIDTPTGTTFLSGDKTVNNTTLYYQFNTAQWSTGLVATFPRIVLSNDGFAFPYNANTTQYTTPTNTVQTVTGGAAGSTITVVVIGGGGGGAGNGGPGGNGGVATYTFTGVALNSTISYYIGSGGAGSSTSGGGGGTNSYVTIGSTTVYAGGGGGANYGGDGVGQYGGISGGYSGYQGGISPFASVGPQVGTYGNGGGGSGISGSSGVIVISYIPAYVAPNLAITGVTLLNENGAGSLILRASNAYSVTWTYPGYTTLGGGGSSAPTTALSVNYGAISATGTTYSPIATLTLAYNGYTNGAPVPSFTAPTFGFGTITFGDSTNYSSKRLTANWSITSAGTWTGTTTSTWGFPQYTSNGGGYYQLSTTGTRNPTTDGAFVDYSTTQRGSNYAIATGQISLNYAGVTSYYTGSTLTAQSANPAVSSVATGNSGGTITLTGAGTAGGVWSGSTPTGLTGPTIAGNVLTYTGGVTGQTYSFNVFVTATGFTSAAFPVSYTVPSVTGTISTITLAYASGTPPNGINSSFTASFTPNATSNLIVLYDTPEAGLYDARYNAQTQTLTSGLTTTFNNGGLNTNVVYRIGAAQSINGNRGAVAYRNIVYPAAVTNLVWGSSSGSSDKSLANENTFWISWTPITFDPAVSAALKSRFTYTLYSGTTPPSVPSLTAPTGATGYAGYAYTQSSIQVGIASIGTSGTFFIVTRYADPGGYSYYSAASAVVKFTYGSVSYTSGNQRFPVVGANTYANISVVGAGGGSANAGNGGGSSSGGGGGGYINYYGYRGIQYYDQIFVTAGGGGANGDTGAGGQGGSANGVAGNAGNTNSANGVNNNPPNGGGRGGGGGARFFGVTTTSSC